MQVKWCRGPNETRHLLQNMEKNASNYQHSSDTSFSQTIDPSGPAGKPLKTSKAEFLTPNSQMQYFIFQKSLNLGFCLMAIVSASVKLNYS